MSHIKFDYSKVLDKFVAPHELDYMQPQVTAADSALRNWYRSWGRNDWLVELA